MFKSAYEAYIYLYANSDYKSSLEKMNLILNKYDDFHENLKYIHVTGTNGKGSSCNYINSILVDSNYKVGLFTSPHLIDFNERIKINNLPISDEHFLNLVNQFIGDFIELKMSLFEILTFLALRYFYEQAVDIAIIEVGIGGRLDSTNVINPLISVITTIGLDHADFLGSTVEEVAFEKSGIIKGGCEVVVGAIELRLLNIIKEKKEQLIQIGDYELIAITPKIEFNYKQFKNVKLNTIAKYQINNALIALEVALVLQSKYNFVLSDILGSLEKAFWPGRFEKIDNIYLDGAHNVEGITTLIESIKVVPYEKLYIVKEAKH